MFRFIAYVLLLPTSVVFLIASIVMRKKPPKYEAAAYGYRSRRAGINAHTWQYAQKCSNNYLCVISFI